ncbi:DUF4194 domain-containing protein [Desulfallas sp. Bu1-1]|uniref:DUF4194 domain-containing protein n=1 Tax=Desulfallas sp. Bu1-1 TaxID=2787620 RepID=UPI0018A10D36|nr:DUF4194 domain-containing protein [Desulfallas sp. Bu1-1]MBF7081628.1 DUF4194 domain-containing protein [Desulfallas sp. Bu1-1]
MDFNFQPFNTWHQREREEFTRIVNKLLAVTFITRKNEEDRRDYYFIERNEGLFRDYLALAGWTLVADKSYGVYQVINEFAFNRLRLKLEESIILLIIRLCYEEKRKEINLADNIMLRVREIQEKYAALQIRKRPIDKKSLRETVALLKRFNILRPLDADATDPECRLEIFPTILFAVRVEDVRSIHDKLDTYRDSGNGAAPPGEDEDDGEDE